MTEDPDDRGLPKSKLTVFGRPYRSTILWWVLGALVLAGAIGSGVMLQRPQSPAGYGH